MPGGMLVQDRDIRLATKALMGLPQHWLQDDVRAGMERLAAIVAGEENIREVIAFPKTQSGADPLTNAPTPIDPDYLDELGLRLLPRKA